MTTSRGKDDQCHLTVLKLSQGLLIKSDCIQFKRLIIFVDPAIASIDPAITYNMIIKMLDDLTKETWIVYL